MNRQKFNVNNLRIASPCPADWEKMAGDNRRRYCDLCQLNVYNFSEMSAKEIENLFAESESRICGQLYKRADGTVLTKECPVGLRAYQKRAARFAGAALTAILGLFSVSFGQKTDEKAADDSKVKIVRTLNRENILGGTVIDPGGALIPNAEILLRQGETIIDSTHSNEDGAFSFSSLKIGNFLLEITSPGFKKRVIENLEIKSAERSRIDITVKLDVGAAGGACIIVNDPEIKPEEVNPRPEKEKPVEPAAPVKKIEKLR